MKKKKKFSLKVLCSSVLVLGLLFIWFNRTKRPLKPEQTSSESGMSARSEPMLENIQNVIPQKNSSQNIGVQRKKFLTRLNINTQVFSPKIVENSFQLVFKMQIVERSCKDGDIDVIRKIEGPEGKLLLTLEEDSGKIVASKKLGVSDLKSNYIVPFSVKTSKSLKVLRLSLCSVSSKSTCIGLPVLKGNSLPVSFQNPDAKAPFEDYTYYAYSFAVVDNEVHLFDATNIASEKNVEHYLAEYNGDERQRDFIARTALDQKAIGILPLRLEDQTIVLPLYANNKSLCTFAKEGVQRE